MKKYFIPFIGLILFMINEETFYKDKTFVFNFIIIQTIITPILIVVLTILLR